MSNVDSSGDSHDHDSSKPNAWRDISVSTATIMTGLIAFIAVLAGNMVNGCVAIGLERERLQSEIIIKSIETGDIDSARNNLRFFIELGLLDSNKGRLNELLGDDGRVPVLPATNTQQRNPLLLEIVDMRDPVEVGEITTYSVWITNATDREIHDVKLIFSLLTCEYNESVPAGIYDKINQTVSFSIGSMAPRQQYKVTVSGKYSEPGEKIVFVRAISGNPVSYPRAYEHTIVY